MPPHHLLPGAVLTALWAWQERCYQIRVLRSHSHRYGPPWYGQEAADEAIFAHADCTLSPDDIEMNLEALDVWW